MRNGEMYVLLAAAVEPANRMNAATAGQRALEAEVNRAR